jgi:hypothetical protein
MSIVVALEPSQPPDGEILRVNKNDREMIIFSLETLAGTIFLNAHTFTIQGGKLVSIGEKGNTIPLSDYQKCQAILRKAEIETAEVRQAYDALEKELLIRQLVSPFKT